VEPRSIVFPRNEHNPAFDDVLIRNGIEAYRGNPHSWIWRARHRDHTRFWIRAFRRLDAYLGMDRGRGIPWSRLRPIDGLVDIPASFLVRPGASRLRERRLHAAIRRAAKRGEVVHLWWHPHNFGVRTEENMTMLRSLFEVFAEERSARGMMSLSMSDVVDLVSPAARRGRAATA